MYYFFLIHSIYEFNLFMCSLIELKELVWFLPCKPRTNFHQSFLSHKKSVSIYKNTKCILYINKIFLLVNSIIASANSLCRFETYFFFSVFLNFFAAANENLPHEAHERLDRTFIFFPASVKFKRKKKKCVHWKLF